MDTSNYHINGRGSWKIEGESRPRSRWNFTNAQGAQTTTIVERFNDVTVTITESEEHPTLVGQKLRIFEPLPSEVKRGVAFVCTLGNLGQQEFKFRTLEAKKSKRSKYLIEIETLGKVRVDKDLKQVQNEFEF